MVVVVRQFRIFVFCVQSKRMKLSIRFEQYSRWSLICLKVSSSSRMPCARKNSVRIIPEENVFCIIYIINIIYIILRLSFYQNACTVSCLNESLTLLPYAVWWWFMFNRHILLHRQIKQKWCFFISKIGTCIYSYSSIHITHFWRTVWHKKVKNISG